jgi:iron complex transport system substrate-binding protein
MAMKLKTGLFILAWVSGWVLSAGAAGPVPQRVISMSPHFTEIIYDIGAQDQLVGVTNFCKFPPEAQNKTKVGGFFNPNFETIVSLRPDLVLLVPFYGQTIQSFKKLGIPVLVQNNSSIRDIFDTYDLLGKTLGCEARARAAKQKLQARLDRVREHAGTRKPVTVLFVVGHNVGELQRIYAAGDHCFVGEIIALSGGSNVLTGTSIAFPLVSKEQLIKRDPDVIVDSMPSDEATGDTVAKAKAAWASLPSLKAVRENHVYFLKQDEFLIPGPTMVGLAEYLSKIFDEVQK